jgi:transaldolase
VTSSKIEEQILAEMLAPAIIMQWVEEQLTVGTPLNFEQGATNHLIYDQEEIRELTAQDTVTIPVNLAVELLDLVRAAKTHLRPKINRTPHQTSFEQLSAETYFCKLIDMTEVLAAAIREFDQDNFEEEMVCGASQPRSSLRFGWQLHQRHHQGS